MKYLTIWLAACAIGFTTGLKDNEDDLMKQCSTGFDERPSSAQLTARNGSSELQIEFERMLESYEPVLDDTNRIILEKLNGTKLNLASTKVHPHTKLNTLQIIQLYNYTVEEHNVTTEDGYILKMFRITGNKAKPSAKPKPPVFLMHGLMAASVDWVLTGPDRGLAFLLADGGYDVWLGNNRGNTYSRRNIRMTPDKKKFWRFTWHEIGIIDLPTMIDYVLRITQNKQLTYVGHSQGTTTILVLLSEKPAYNAKIKAIILLAPVAYSSNMISPFLRFFARFEASIRFHISVFGPWEVRRSEGITEYIMKAVCKGLTAKLCINSIFIVTGFNEEQFEEELLPAVLSHYPASASMYQLAHYAQLINSGNFEQFNDNLVAFFPNPSSYNLKKVNASTYIFYGNNDWLTNEKDVKKLESELPNLVKSKKINNTLFNHIDFLFAKDIRTLLYNDIMQIINKLNS